VERALAAERARVEETAAALRREKEDNERPEVNDTLSARRHGVVARGPIAERHRAFGAF